MDLHQNARLTFRSREALANQIMIEKVTLNAAAAAFNVSHTTAAKWVPPLSHPGVARLAGSFLAAPA
jgi:leucine-zipper of insertion element IS481